MTAKAAALVLADHTFSYSSMDHGDHCACGATGPDHAAHQAEVLDRAGLLAPGAPRLRALIERILDLSDLTAEQQAKIGREAGLEHGSKERVTY